MKIQGEIMIGITDKAKEMLLQFQQKADDDIERVLRVEIIGRGECESDAVIEPNVFSKRVY